MAFSEDPSPALPVLASSTGITSLEPDSSDESLQAKVATSVPTRLLRTLDDEYFSDLAVTVQRGMITELREEAYSLRRTYAVRTWRMASLAIGILVCLALFVTKTTPGWIRALSVVWLGVQAVLYVAMFQQNSTIGSLLLQFCAYVESNFPDDSEPGLPAAEINYTDRAKNLFEPVRPRGASSNA